MKIILASTSPRRHQILKQFGIKYSFVKPTADEDEEMRGLIGKDPVEIACRLAYVKAFSVLPKIKKGLILGSDTIVVLKGRVIGKPKSKEHAYKTLFDLSRNTHCVVTAVAFINAADGKTLVTYDRSYVTFRKLSPAWIRNYIETNHVMDKAGAYAVQENSDPFIKRIKGSYYNVVGLPIEKVKRVLKMWNKL